MGVVEAFLSTWTDTWAIFGLGVPQPGAAFDQSARLRALRAQLGTAADDEWTGTAAAAYAVVHAEQQRVLDRLAELDGRLGRRLDESAEVVSGGRRELDALRRWVLDATAAAPPEGAGEHIRAAIVAQGLGRLSDIVTRSHGELGAIAARIGVLATEYDALRH
ncbi:EspA/EspE family type VII secretion system effector [Mycolicibacterium bacteremicum]|uniref:EspA/EspE family type VII secretion system effector n=1 Tax=Mycolicibacterium bacteremicum TaxID=564198 RepID=UPI0026E93E71|nr:EspA/EspE family type VII secretion system effector [Mycolicibacterium bacteremicum]